ncbi:MAG: enoyl-CoA hydratase/isomerase family protein [Deltaproteobacteria bacterium]|nr:enoyl-CoA hydratase/isomerase family protein [Deltaproteobacteria bacterium]
MSEYETIIYEPGPVTRIIHSESEKRNVIGPQFEREFLDAMKRFERDDDAKVAVNLATGKHFAAGHDIGKLSKKQSWKKGKKLEMTSVEWRKLNDPRKGINRVRDVTKPLIAGVQGAALAAGAGFVLDHDIIVMGENAFLGFEIARVSGGGAGSLVLSLGYAKAFEILCSGWNIGAHELYRLDAINKVVPDGF